MVWRASLTCGLTWESTKNIELSTIASNSYTLFLDSPNFLCASITIYVIFSLFKSHFLCDILTFYVIFSIFM